MNTLVFTVAIAVYWTVGVVVFAARRRDYRHVRATIAELAERGANDARAVTIALWLPVGIACLVVAAGVALRPSRFPELVAGVTVLATSIAIGYLGTALCPCDPGSPVRGGSDRQTIHGLIATVHYAGAASALWMIGRAPVIARDATLPTIFFAGACVVGFLLVLLSVEQTRRVRGLLQRVAELVCFGALVASVRLLEHGGSLR